MQLKQFLIIFLIILSGPLFSQEPGEVPSELENKIYSLVDQIENNPTLQTANVAIDEITTLPKGIVKTIGGSVYCLAIDEATFKNDRAFFSAYMAIDFPGANHKLAFAADEIGFDPEGIVVGESLKIYLVADNLLHLGPNIDLFLAGDGSNFIEFDCNGYKQTHLKGEFRFKGEMLVPTTPGAQYVTAVLDITIEDLSNLYATVTMSPFEVKGMEGYKISVSEASVDWSDYQNPAYALPTSYTTQMNADAAANGTSADPLLWRGFYLKNLTVTLPPKFNKSEEAAPETSSIAVPTGGTGSSVVGNTTPPAPTDGTPTTIYASNLFIDNSGVTGVFGATNVLGTGTGSKGDMGGWPFTIETLSVGLQSNNLVMGSMGGKITIPVLDDNNLTYLATITQTAATTVEPITPKIVNYQFVMGLTNNEQIPLTKLKSMLVVYNTSTLTVTTDNITKKFVPSLNLDGLLTINYGSTASFANIGFQDLVVNTTKAYVHGGTYALTGQLKFANFSISLLEFKLIQNDVDKEVRYKTRFKMVFGESDNADATSFTADAGFSIYAKYEFSGSDNKRLKYDRFIVDNISFLVNTTPFRLQGTLIFKENDPVFGKLFYGEIYLTIKSIMDEPAIVRAGFGKISGVDGYKYWYTDAQIPVNIKLGQVTLTSLIGGVSNRVRQTQTNLELMAKANSIPTVAQIDPPFVPDNTYGLNVKAGVGFKHTANESIINGQAVLALQFNPNGGLLNVTLDGEAYMLVDIADRQNPDVKNRIYATCAMAYDVVPKRFTAAITGECLFGGAIEGNVKVNIHIEPNLWYVWINRPTDRATLSMKRPNGDPLFAATAYFQFGTQIDPPGPLPTWAADIGGLANATVNNAGNANLISGKGLSVGMDITANFAKEYKVFSGSLADYYASLDLGLGLGFDLMIIQYPDEAHCEGSSGEFGLNNKYCTGNMYFSAHAACGGKRVKQSDGEITHELDLFDVTLKGLVTGRFPKPTYVAGTVSAELTFLSFINLNYDFSFEFGEYCNPVM